MSALSRGRHGREAPLRHNEGELTRCGVGAGVDAVELAHLVLDEREERDVDGERDEREDGGEEGRERREERASRARGGTRSPSRPSLYIRRSGSRVTQSGGGGRGCTDGVDGKAARPGGPDVDEVVFVGAGEDGGGVGVVGGVAAADAGVFVPAARPV